MGSRLQRRDDDGGSGRPIDRLVHHSVIIELNIPSYRVEHAQKNQQAESQGEEE
jgi:hypothetical protein